MFGGKDLNYFSKLTDLKKLTIIDHHIINTSHKDFDFRRFFKYRTTG